MLDGNTLEKPQHKSPEKETPKAPTVFSLGDLFAELADRIEKHEEGYNQLIKDLRQAVRTTEWVDDTKPISTSGYLYAFNQIRLSADDLIIISRYTQKIIAEISRRTFTEIEASSLNLFIQRILVKLKNNQILEGVREEEEQMILDNMSEEDKRYQRKFKILSLLFSRYYIRNNSKYNINEYIFELKNIFDNRFDNSFLIMLALYSPDRLSPEQAEALITQMKLLSKESVGTAVVTKIVIAEILKADHIQGLALEDDLRRLQSKLESSIEGADNDELWTLESNIGKDTASLLKYIRKTIERSSTEIYADELATATWYISELRVSYNMSGFVNQIVQNLDQIVSLIADNPAAIESNTPRNLANILNNLVAMGATYEQVRELGVSAIILSESLESKDPYMETIIDELNYHTEIDMWSKIRSEAKIQLAIARVLDSNRIEPTKGDPIAQPILFRILDKIENLINTIDEIDDGFFFRIAFMILGTFKCNTRGLTSKDVNKSLTLYLDTPSKQDEDLIVSIATQLRDRLSAA